MISDKIWDQQWMIPTMIQIDLTSDIDGTRVESMVFRWLNGRVRGMGCSRVGSCDARNNIRFCLVDNLEIDPSHPFSTRESQVQTCFQVAKS